MKIAIVGSGIAGLTAAYILSKEHAVSVFEQDDWLGGHTHTVATDIDGCPCDVDTGFIVFNRQTYPNFCRLLQQLNVAYQATDMSFSVFCEQSTLAYNSRGLRGYFDRLKQMASYHHWYQLYEINAFNRRASEFFQQDNSELSLQDFLQQHGFSDYFYKFYLNPLIASIWSMPPASVLSFPAKFLFQFLHNHGLLSMTGKLHWYVIKGGSQQYVEALVAQSSAQFMRRQPVKKIIRHQQGVELQFANETLAFDKVIIATHSDQALALLEQPSALEQTILQAIPYQKNYVTLHTDKRLMPPKQKTWASWNYYIPKTDHQLPMVNYHMNRLQGFTHPTTDFFVSLAQSDDQSMLAADSIIDHYVYSHPVFTTAGRAAQQRHAEINGQQHTYFCGAYWRYGFHEDGVVSALAVAKDFGLSL